MVGFLVLRPRPRRDRDRRSTRPRGQPGRTWTCTDRSITGFPVRIELRCSALSLTSTRWGDAVRIETGPALAVGQIYTPGLVILELTSPARATLPEGRTLDITWKSLDASLAWRNPERFALVAKDRPPS